ncbi:VCBS domain-containing protein, partial [Arcobacter sp. LA11]|uniref:beta strand repeat-containing protein n=1 Tax=Arcobacter sp. LA11 TaxID=1898176 RepID=UPI000AB5035D
NNEASISDWATVTFTVIGTNDQPQIDSIDAQAVNTLIEGDGTATLSTSGAIAISDLDVNDILTLESTYNGDISWSGDDADSDIADLVDINALIDGFSVSILDGTAPTGNGTWDFTTSQDLDFLANGETITLSYDIVVKDDSGAVNDTSTTQTVNITITGTNDTPVAVDDSTVTTFEQQIINSTFTPGNEDGVTISVDNTSYNANLVEHNGGWGVHNDRFFGDSNQIDGYRGDDSITFTFDNPANSVTVTLGDMQSNDDYKWSAETSVGTIYGSGDSSSFIINGTDITSVKIWAEGNNDDFVVISVATEATVMVPVVTSLATLENNNLTINVLANDYDLDENDTVSINNFDTTATLTGVLDNGNPVTGGTIEEVAGELVFKPGTDFDYLAVGETQEVTFTYDVIDDSNPTNAVSNTATVTIIVTGTNDQPSIESIEKIDGIKEKADLVDWYGNEEMYTILSHSMVLSKSTIADDDLTDTHTLELPNPLTGSGASYTYDATTIFDQSTSNGIYDPTLGGTTVIHQVTQSLLNLHPGIPASANIGDFLVFNVKFNNLGEGEKATVTFNVIANDGTNDPSGETNLSAPKQVTVEIEGTNDQPVITSASQIDIDARALISEDIPSDTSGVVTYSETIQGTDEDSNDTHTIQLNSVSGIDATNGINIGTDSNPVWVGVSLGNLNGGNDLTIADITGLGITFDPIINGNGIFSTGYNFTGNFNSLAAGETATITFDYVVSDGNTGIDGETSESTVQQVTLVVTGTNDTPVATSFTHEGPASNDFVWENSGQQVIIDPATDFGTSDANSLAAYDIDLNDTLTIGTLSSTHGSVTFDGINSTSWLQTDGGVYVRVNANGKVEYNLNVNKVNGETAFDKLDAGDTLNDTFTFTVIDNNGQESNSATATIKILGTNDRPKIDDVKVSDFTTINEDDTINSGNVVSSLIAGAIIDFDESSVEGIAITGIDNTNGVWQYSLDGSVWSNIDPTVSATNATMLYDTASVRFVPNENYYGSADISFKAWDQTGYNLTNGSTGIDTTSSYGGYKGSTSEDIATSTVEVDSVPDFVNWNGTIVNDSTDSAKVYEVGIEDATNDSETASKTYKVEFGDDTPGMVIFTNANVAPSWLKSGGESVSYSVSPDGKTLTAIADGETVFTVVNDNTATPSYTVTMSKAIDHVETGQVTNSRGERQWLSFQVQAEDNDGDTVTSTPYGLSIGFYDDVPTVASYETNTMRIISDDDTVAGLNGNSGYGNNPSDGA